MSDGGLAREDLASLLHDLPRGTHVMAYASMTDPDALRSCDLAAREANEQWMLHGLRREGIPHDILEEAETFPDFTPETWRVQLEQAIARARARGKAGVLLTIFPDARMRAHGPQGHLDAEQALGQQAPEGARVICIYTSGAEAMMAKRLPLAEGTHALVYTLLGAR
ncbi:MAG TPA: hypothetical protein VFH47_08585 [Candidatus Thermoplasmatota archaeon]|nr:hypothetical protein [Candidatus Thermoplasmatota archaeon]